MKKRFLCILLTIVMVIGMLPTGTVFAANAINSVSVSLTAPVGGMNPDFNAIIPANAPYEVLTAFDSDNDMLNDGVLWIDPAKMSAIPKYETFVTGQTYQVTVYLVAKEGYEFSASATGKLNGATGDVLHNIADNVMQLAPGRDIITIGYDYFIAKAPVVYEVTTGNDSTIDLSDYDAKLTVTADVEFSKFTGVKVDGVLVHESEYTAKSGSTIVEMDRLYLLSLDPGEHEMTMLFTDGIAETNFTVNPVPYEKAAVWVAGIGLNDGDYLAVGASATMTTKPSGGYAYYNNGVLTLHNYTYSGPGRGVDIHDYAAIGCDTSLTIQLEGSNEIYAKGNAGGDALFNYGIFAYGSLSFTGGAGDTLKVTSNHVALASTNGIEFYGGEVTAVGIETMAIHTGNGTAYFAGNLNAVASEETDGKDAASYDESLNDSYHYVKVGTPAPIEAVSVKKVDDAGNPLAGAVFTLSQRIDGVPDYTATSDAQGIATFKNIPEGAEYYLWESEAPAGYIPSDDMYILNLVNGKVSYPTEPTDEYPDGEVEYTNDDPFVFVNVKSKTAFYVTKTDGENPLAGATFALESTAAGYPLGRRIEGLYLPHHLLSKARPHRRR